MKQKALVLCDAEVDYAQQMAGFLERDHDFPWEIIVCTGIGELDQVFRNKAVEILVVAESLIHDELPRYPTKQLVLLNESGRIRFTEVKNIDKYQAADNIRNALLRLCAEQKEFAYPVLERGKSAECIAFYSPIRRCLQTSIAITFSQLLAEKYRVLYLNFECFSQFAMVPEEGESMDMTCLLYYIDAGEEEFALRLRAMRKSIGNWEYIMPMCNGENLAGTEAEDWLRLVGRCRAMETYDFVVLDLNDSMQGLFEILRQCDGIYTIVKNDSAARKKLDRYEYVLGKKKYEDILQRTVRLQPPVFCRLPEGLEDYSRGELADYVRRNMILEDGNGIYGVEEEAAE